MFKNPKLVKYFAIALFLIAALVWIGFFQLEDNRLHIYFFDVGQGDSILVKTPDDHKILIDGGPDNKVLAYLGEKLPFWDRKIDLVVLTHPHADHISGLVEVLKNYKVGEVIATGVIHTSAEYLKFLDLIKESNVKFTPALIGQKYKFGKIRLEVLYPFEVLAGQRVEDLNNSSVVTRLKYRDFSVLFCGDISQNLEDDLISNFNFQVNILKVPHHGSKTSLSDKFLEVVSPEVAVISVGKNKFGHPAGEVLNKLKNTRILRTDVDGTIEIASDGQSYEIKTEKFGN